MNTDSALVFAKVLDGQGGATSFTELETVPETNQAVWYHFDANHPDAKDIMLQSFADVDEYSVEAIFHQEARPRILELDNGVLIILRGINHNKEGDPEDMIGIRLWVSGNKLISLLYRKSKALSLVADSIDAGRGPKTIGDVVAAISSRIFDYISGAISTLEEKMDSMEAAVLEEPDKQLRRDISDIRKSAIILRRYITPQKEAMAQLRRAEIQWLSANNMRRLQEAQDSLLRSIEELDAIRERSQVVKDELVNALSDKLNRNLYVISVITAIFLPLGFLTGLFGINVGGMPGVDQETAFTIFSCVLGFIVLIQVVLFKYFKWF